MADTQQNSVTRILEELKPENLVAEAAKVKQASTTPVMPESLAKLPIPQDNKVQIHTDLLKSYSALVRDVALPASIADLPLPEEDKKSIAVDVLKDASAESTVDPHTVLQVAFSKHTELETTFYQNAINQSRQSFIVALVAAAIAVLAFLVAIVVLLANGTASSNTATITAIGGAIAALISGLNFYLYGMTSTQFAAFHSRLDRMERFSLAEYMCELLGTELATAESVRDKALAVVIANLASSSLADNPTYITALAPPSVSGGQNGAGGKK